MDGSPSLAAVRARLRARCRRLTAQRLVAAEVLVPQPHVFSAAALVKELAVRGVSRPTVYRMVELLERMKILGRVLVDGRAHYVVCDESQHHHHLRCTSCGEVLRVSSPQVELEVQKLAERHRFEVRVHRLELAGRCAVCDRRAPRRSGRAV